MVLQKAMKQGRNIHGIPILDACSDHNITSRMCGHVGGHAYSVSVFEVVTGIVLAHSVSKSQTYLWSAH